MASVTPLPRRNTLKQPAMRPDPRIRQAIDHLTHTLEAAADTARTGCFTFTKSFVEPCLSSLLGCCTSCLPGRQPTHNHHRYSARRSEYPFGFYAYDDYASDSDDAGAGRGFLAWGTDELDRLLAGTTAGGSQGERMYYGAVEPGIRRKQTEDHDPTVIPSTSMFGFMTRFGVRGRGMRYKPSAANLQEHPIRGGSWDESVSGRKRSGTESSAASQGDSLRSRGDLWPSEDEDDAVVIGDDVFVGVDGNGTGSDNDYAEYAEYTDYDDDADAGEVDLLLRQEEHEDEERRRRKRELERRKREIQRGKAAVRVSPSPDVDMC